MSYRKRQAVFFIVILALLAAGGSQASSSSGECSCARENNECEAGSSTDVNGQTTLPPNIMAPTGLKTVLNSMLLRSATFRRQCRLLREAANVRIELECITPGAYSYRAKSIVTRSDGGSVTIKMRLVAPSDYIEMVGHEFEHAIEQTEGLDLKALVAAPGHKAYRVEDGSFETQRAIRVGRLVLDEYYRCKHNH
jgi:hypothetical protein